MLYTRFVIGDDTESSTIFIRRHSAALSTTVNSFILDLLMGNIGSLTTSPKTLAVQARFSGKSSDCSNAAEISPDASALIRYMKRIVFTALGVPPRQSGRADSVRHLRESGDLKGARRRAMESLRGASAGTRLLINIHERLKEEARTLEAIDRRREDEDNPYIGLDVEERILTRELRDLERAAVAHDMGAE
jgi:hypothetical protein